jgi:hypothetical protein
MKTSEPRLPPFPIDVFVDDNDGRPVVMYTFNMNSPNQRAVFAQQMINAYLGGQIVTTHMHNWSLKAGQRQRVQTPRFSYTPSPEDVDADD